MRINKPSKKLNAFLLHEYKFEAFLRHVEDARPFIKSLRRVGFFSKKYERALTDYIIDEKLKKHLYTILYRKSLAWSTRISCKLDKINDYLFRKSRAYKAKLSSELPRNKKGEIITKKLIKLI
jgi:hypothetical protein